MAQQRAHLNGRDGTGAVHIKSQEGGLQFLGRIGARRHQLAELVEPDIATSIVVDTGHHFLNCLVGDRESTRQLSHGISKLRHTDGAAVVEVKLIEDVAVDLYLVRVGHTAGLDRRVNHLWLFWDDRVHAGLRHNVQWSL